MTEAVRQFAGLGLAEAKRVTDDVLEGRSVVVSCSSRTVAAALAARLNELGAVAEVDRDDSGAGVA
jgi:ribosomal protein L7/L12